MNSENYDEFPEAGKVPEASPIDYFDRYLRGKTGRPLIRDLRSLSVAFEVRLVDLGDASWYVEIVEGTLVHVGRHGSAPQCVFALDSRTLLDIVGAVVPPQEAFFDMRVEIGGDVESGLRLGTALESFFEQYPYPS